MNRQLRGNHPVWVNFINRWVGDFPTPFDIFYTGIALGLFTGASITIFVLSLAGALK